MSDYSEYIPTFSNSKDGPGNDPSFPIMTNLSRNKIGGKCYKELKSVLALKRKIRKKILKNHLFFKMFILLVIFSSTPPEKLALIATHVQS